MNLKVRLRNLGILKHAEFTLGDLTIICGKNNTGKTYAAYALYGFLKSWHNFTAFPVSNEQIQNLLVEGTIKLELGQYFKTAADVLTETSKKYSNQLDRIFAAKKGRFHNSEFQIQTEANDPYKTKLDGLIVSGQEPLLTYSKRKGSQEIIFTLSKREEREIDPIFVKNTILQIVSNIIFADAFPNTFISSAERTGVAIFRRELNYARKRLLEEMVQTEEKIDPRELLFKVYQSYPQPIEDNAEFTRELEDIAKRESFVAKEHPEILAEFADIIGGDYNITENDQLYFIPTGSRLKLTMVESSSSVRSLLDIGFYLRCLAEEGDLLIIDEPELNLHPENQRRIAKLFARLINLKVKVFITTHSDYIVKELNTLIMLNNDKPHLKRIAEENNYQNNELISANQVKVYVAKKALLPLEEGRKKRTRGHTLVPADIDPELGIQVSSFDETIEAMNRIQRDIVWGGE